MTAVEWLLENLISEPYSEADFKYNAECWDKAKEIEKQQITEAFDSDYDYWFTADNYYELKFNKCK